MNRMVLSPARMMLLSVIVATSAAAQTADAGAPRPIEPVEAMPATDAPVEAGTPEAGGAASATTSTPFAMQARVEPSRVPFAEAFFLVVDIEREQGQNVTFDGDVPQNDACQRNGEPTRTVIPVAPKAGEVDAGTARPRVRETLRIPYLALDTTDVKTPPLKLLLEGGATIDVPALPVSVDAAPLAPPTGPDGGVLTGPDGGPVPDDAVALEPAATTLTFAVADERPYVVLTLLLATLLLLVLLPWVKRLLPTPTVVEVKAPPPPPRPAHEVALERLDALLAAGLLVRGETAPFVERLMDEVLRDYITARFALAAGTRTTRELVASLLGVAAPGLDVALTEQLLKDSDLVKFAKASIASEQAHAMAVRVRTLVLATATTTPTTPMSGGAA